MTKLQIFDPPMCCTSGVCGTNVDTKLVKLLNDIEWLKLKGVEVERYGLAFEPQAFVSNPVVKETLEKDGNDCLPLVLVDNKVVSKGSYPDRAKLAELCGVKFEEETATDAENVSVGCCGPDCDCHKPVGGNKFQKTVIAIILIAIACIIVAKTCCKAGAAEFDAVNRGQDIDSIQLVNNKLATSVNSINQAKKSGQDAAFIFVPAQNSSKIDSATKSAVTSAQKTLKAKGIKTGLYTLNPSSVDYGSISNQVKLPAVLVVGKSSNRGMVSGKVTVNKLLQAYMVSAQVGCGADCPCHHK